MRINFARLNHILIPPTKAGRDRFRKGLIGRAIRPMVAVLGSLTDEGQLAFLVLLLAGAFGLDVRSTETYLLFAALFGALLSSLIFARAYRMLGARIEVQVARRVTLGEPATFTVVVHNDGPRDLHAVRVSGPFLPWDGRYVAPAPALRVVPASGAAQSKVQAAFAERGEHHLDPFAAAALVPLGLAVGPAVRSRGVRFLVVPRVANVARVTTPRGRRHQPGGVALASKTGESMDLFGVRPYRPGDPVRDLHARSWARAGIPVVREYHQEYFSRIGVVLDTDSDAADPERLEAAISLAAGVVRHLSRGEALIDLLVVGDRVHDLTLGRSLGTFEQALDLLAEVRGGLRLDAAALTARLSPHLSRLSCVLVIALAWDEERRALEARIRGAGTECTTLLVRDEASDQPGAPLAATPAAILRGDPLWL